MLFYIIVFCLVALDQISKFFTVELLKPIRSVGVAEGVLSFTYVENRGAAFGILQNSRWVFITFTIIAVIGIICYKARFAPRDKLLNVSLCLILSGAIGNLIDRVFLGYVVDMIEVTFIDYPVFNVADCFVVIGALLLAVYILFVYKEPEKVKKEND